MIEKYLFWYWQYIAVGLIAVVMIAVGAILYRRPDLIERVREALPVSQAASSSDKAMTALTSWRAKATYFIATLAAVAVGVFYLSWTLAGPVDTIVYALLFLFFASFVPVSILLFAPSFPRSLKSVFGKLNFVLGQLAYGHGYLVQFDDRWQLCPGSEERVWIDGEWYEIEGGQTNLTVLGWQPFGILRFKDKETMQEYRVDTAAQRATADGGTSDVTRGGFDEVSPPAVTGIDGEWIVDLKKVYSSGLRKVGDTELIETAEEITMRNEAKQSRVGGWEPIIGSAIGILLGVLTGYVMLGGMG